MRKSKEVTPEEQIKRRSKKPVEEPKPIQVRDDLLVHTGSTMLNLACSDRTIGGYLLGTFVNVVGGNSSGKTMAILSMFAECARDSRFDNYRFIYDEPEVANEFDMITMYGKKMAERLEPASWHRENKKLVSKPSRTIEDFMKNFGTALRNERPCIYVLDSLDAISDDAELERYDKFFDGKELKGTYGMAKAKGSSSFFRVLTQDLKQTKSLLVIISQTRDNTDPMAHQKERRSGGNALDFYASIVGWLTVIQRLKELDLITGHHVNAAVKKNKLTGNERTVLFDTYNKYGIDDTNSIIDFMLKLEKWEKISHGSSGMSVIIPELNIELNRKELVDRLDTDAEFKTQQILPLVETAWNERELLITPKRAPKYQ